MSGVGDNHPTPTLTNTNQASWTCKTTMFEKRHLSGDAAPIFWHFMQLKAIRRQLSPRLQHEKSQVWCQAASESWPESEWFVRLTLVWTFCPRSTLKHVPHCFWLVVSTPLNNMKVSWDDYSKHMESHKIHVPNHQPGLKHLRQAMTGYDIWCFEGTRRSHIRATVVEALLNSCAIWMGMCGSGLDFRHTSFVEPSDHVIQDHNQWAQIPADSSVGIWIPQCKNETATRPGAFWDHSPKIISWNHSRNGPVLNPSKS